MLVVPMVNGKNIVNIKVEFKDLENINYSTYLANVSEGEIIANGKNYSESPLNVKNGNEYTNVTKFIRANSLSTRNSFITITTREEIDSDLYDVYSAPLPPRYVSDGLDKLYGAALIDCCKQIPDCPKGRNISLKKLGVLENIDEEKIKKLREVVRSNKLTNTKEFSEIMETLDFIKIFNFELINNSVLSKELIEYQIETLKPTNTDLYKKIKTYYQTALDNEDVYKRLVYMNRLLYDTPLNLIKIKPREEIDMQVKIKRKRKKGNIVTFPSDKKQDNDKVA